MTDNNEFDPLPELTSGEDAEQLPHIVSMAARVPQQTAASGGGGGGQNEMAGLVLLINTVLGGLGTLYMTTKSAGITLASALLVLLLTVVVLVVRRVVAPGDGPQGKDARGGK